MCPAGSEEQVVQRFLVYLLWGVAGVADIAFLALLTSGLIKLLSFLIPRARLRLTRIAKVTALVSICILAPLYFFVLLFTYFILSATIQSLAVAAIILGMMVTISWLFFRLLPTQDTPERHTY